MNRFSRISACKRLKITVNHIVGRRMSTNSECSAGIIVIGDEILKGQTEDTNSHFICKHLFSLGVKVKKISVIGDDLDTIAREVSLFSKSFTHVITTGGIGPTHDDKTFEGIAKAFDDVLEPNPVLVELCKEYFGPASLDSPKMKLAMVPKSATTVYGYHPETGQKNKFPLVTIKNVYIFPGVPQLLERSFITLEHLFKNPSKDFYTREIYVDKDEVSIADILNTVDSKHNNTVILGSYPDFNNSYYKVKLVLESETKKDLDDACHTLTESLPKDCIVEYDKSPIHHAVDKVYGIVNSCERCEYTNNVREAVKILEECLDKYGLDDLCVGFNGGKDCTVLLHLFYSVAKKKFPVHKDKYKALYIKSKSVFPEVEKFIQISRDNYSLEMLNYHGRIKDSLTELKKGHPGIKAVIMGTRKTDPYSCHLESFSMTDADWPQFMRVNPLLNWSYKHIWKFLRSLNIPYCSLYDRGYTSLGSMNNTHPNPHLQYIDDRGILSYHPAHTLVNENSERHGRNT
ncbi:FAD synthase-like [Mytilus edulis]|uniref:FAD synthase-like n=1 Tax=Mytilus edulis TaxID=6550 RepID=UPI0039F05C37